MGRDLFNIQYLQNFYVKAVFFLTTADIIILIIAVSCVIAAICVKIKKNKNKKDDISAACKGCPYCAGCHGNCREGDEEHEQ